MALTCIHGTMTKDAMKSLGFSDAASDVAAKANMLVDEKQGNTVEEANLHAMRGVSALKSAMAFSPGSALQSEPDARAAVAVLINKGKSDAVEAILRGDFLLGLRRMGETLHTIQDRSFHNFEPWPYPGILDAVRNDPNYMICHVIRDLAVVSDIVLGPNAERKEVELSRRVAENVYVGVRLFDNARSSNPYLPPTSQGPLWNSGFSGYGALFSVTIGAAPGSLPRPGSAVESPAPEAGPLYWQTTTHGVAMRTQAEDDTKEFVRSIERALASQTKGPEQWAACESWNGKASAAVQAQ
jgi:hypothetical protein